MTHTYTLRLLSVVAIAAAGLVSVLAVSSDTMGAGMALLSLALVVVGVTVLLVQRRRYTGRHRT